MFVLLHYMDSRESYFNRSFQGQKPKKKTKTKKKKENEQKLE